MDKDQQVGWHIGKTVKPSTSSLRVEVLVRVRCGSTGVLGVMCGYTRDFTEDEWLTIRTRHGIPEWAAAKGLTREDVFSLRDGKCPHCTRAPVAKEKTFIGGLRRRRYTTCTEYLVRRV